MCSSVILPSDVEIECDASSREPADSRCSSSASKMASPPMIAHRVLVQTPDLVLARRAAPIHGVEGGHCRDFGTGQAELPEQKSIPAGVM